MAGNAHGVDSEGANVKRYVQIALDGVRMEERSRFVGHTCELTRRLHHAGLVVGNHDRDERDVFSHHFGQLHRLYVAGGAGANDVDSKAGCAQKREIIEDGIMLDRADDHAIARALCGALALGHAKESELVRLGAAAGQDDFGGTYAGAERCGQGTPCPLEFGRRPAPERMERVGVDAGKFACVIAPLFLDGFGPHRGRSGKVEVHKAFCGLHVHCGLKPRMPRCRAFGAAQPRLRGPPP